tara:strand:+ start:511 stop:684 length:174 start_codon:yes stop_codon:yes gene_type:complete
MVRIFKPILLAFVKTKAFKKLMVDCLRALSKISTNKLDDQAVDFIEQRLFNLPSSKP